MRRETIKKATGAAAIAGAAGAAGAYFMDPADGRRRRHVVKDRVTAMLRSAKADARREAEYRAGQAVGAAKQARSDLGPEKSAANDQHLAEKVKSELLQPADAPKGSININVQHGVVQIRGEVDSEERRRELAAKAQEIDGVAGVENLMHLPGEPAPGSPNGQAAAQTGAR